MDISNDMEVSKLSAKVIIYSPLCNSKPVFFFC